MLHHRCLALAICAALADPGVCSAALVASFDPNVMATMFQDGNNTGGTIPVTAVNQPVRWITDVRSPTPGGASGVYDNWVDAQQANVAPTLVNSPGGTVLSLVGTSNLLVNDANISPKVDGVLGALDVNTITLLTVGQANTDTGVKSMIDFGGTAPAAANHAFGLRYDNSTNLLEGMVQGLVVASLPLMPNNLFAASLAWDGPNSTATLKLTTSSGTATSSGAASSSAINMLRIRLGKRQDNNGGTFFNGLIGDVRIYNDVASHQDAFNALAASYGIPEPTGLALAALACVACLGGRRFAAKGGMGNA